MYFFQLTNDLRFWCIYYTLWPNFVTGLCIRLIHDRSCHYQNKTCSFCCSFNSTSIVFYICQFTGDFNVFIATMAMVLATKKTSHTATAFELKFICLLISWTHNLWEIELFTQQPWLLSWPLRNLIALVQYLSTN